MWQRSRLMAMSVGGGMMLLASCTDSSLSPSPASAPGRSPAANVVGSFGVPAGTLEQTINSGDAAVHYCDYALTTNPVAGTFTGQDCPTTANNLTLALALYTPGDPFAEWSPPFTNTSWIGPIGDDAPSSDYRARVGTYEYVTSFNVPPGATNLALQMQLKSDNAAVAYLNGSEIGRNAILEDCTVEQGPNCNWVVALNIDNQGASFNVGGANTIRIDGVNTRIGQVIAAPGNTARATCDGGPEQFGAAGFGGLPVLTSAGHELINWSAIGCQNPTGVDFQAKIFFTPATPLFVIGDVEAHSVTDVVNFWGAQWWMNNQMSGQVDPGVAAFKGFASSADNFCGGAWSTQPGNSSDPPETIPANFVIIVTSKVLKNGSTISGDIKQIIVVHQDGNYQDNPGHPGSGTVTSVFCPT
jgi:hypothetical protein